MEPNKIIEHLVDIAKGECTITEESLLKLDNPEDQMIELGLLTLFEEIEFNKRKLEKSNKEKETLLMEIHHRVKNNLQIVGSLLTLPKFYVDDKESIRLLQDCRSRVNTMSIIHEKLYQSKDLSSINYEEYLRDLVKQIKTAHSVSNQSINFRLDVAAIHMTMNTAIPLGLLINEIFTNAIKYGLQDQVTNEIYLELKEPKAGFYNLKIGDLGKGYSDDIFNKAENTLGIQLIKDLTHQLNGTIEKITALDNVGTHYQILFEKI